MDDPLSPARGFIFGCLLGGAIWFGIGLFALGVKLL